MTTSRDTRRKTRQATAAVLRAATDRMRRADAFLLLTVTDGQGKVFAPGLGGDPRAVLTVLRSAVADLEGQAKEEDAHG